jgi:hypothetical protein
MCQILFGDFEGANILWSHDLEQEFLKEHDREHVQEPTDEENKKIGCHRSQISMSKIAQVKNINRNFEWKIQMSVPKECKGDRTGRRKKGDFYLTNKTKVAMLMRGGSGRVVDKCKSTPNRCSSKFFLGPVATLCAEPSKKEV